MRPSAFLVGWFGLTSMVSSVSAFPSQTQNAFPFLGNFFWPVDLQNAGDKSNRLFVVEKDGKIWAFDNDPTVSSKTLFLDISAKVRNDGSNGLLALAFHPDYENNGTFYVMYNTITPNLSRWSRFHVSEDPNVADPLSETSLFEIPQTNPCHKGCALAFGADGYLYISIGDDCKGWPAQDLRELMGKLIRIDVNNTAHGLGYAIPVDNPLVGNPNGWREEVYAWGFRNPWRFSIDHPETDRIFLADVGEATWEEINIVTKGGNYGWIKMEGTECWPNPAVCDTLGMNAVPPIHQYAHGGEVGNAVIGGHVYRGPTLPALWGKYVYADVAFGTFALWFDGASWTSQLIESNTPTRQYSSFGLDEDGELYVVSLYGGIYRFVDTSTDVGASPPALSLHAHPNPFQQSTTFRFESPFDQDAEIHIYDVGARRVATLPAHAGAVTWDGINAQGNELASGVYFAQLHVDGRIVATRQVVIVR